MPIPIEIDPKIDTWTIEQVREKAKNVLLVLSEDSGMGFGICRVASIFAWNDQRPESPEKDWHSIVAIKSPLEKYTKEELICILKIAKVVTDSYDELFRWRMGANIHIFDKRVNVDVAKFKPWFYKRLSYEYGTMWYDSLEEILQSLIKNNSGYDALKTLLNTIEEVAS